MALITVDQTGNRSESDYCRALEDGNVLFFPRTPFELPETDRNFLLGIHLTGAGYHKNIAYRPGADKVTGFAKSAAADVERLRRVMRDYSAQAVQFLAELLPRYAAAWHVDFASFRPQEEEGRDLPMKKRNDLLHTDAFPTRPTRGDMILRVFTNIHPSKERVWVVSDPFASLAPKHAKEAGLQRIAGEAASPLAPIRQGFVRALRAAGLPLTDRTPYDRFMLGFHDYLKFNRHYQQNCPKYRMEFPPGSTWMVFTDVVPHSVLSGQAALEQTVIVSRASLASPQNAPVAILESLSRARLT